MPDSAIPSPCCCSPTRVRHRRRWQRAGRARPPVAVSPAHDARLPASRLTTSVQGSQRTGHTAGSHTPLPYPPSGRCFAASPGGHSTLGRRVSHFGHSDPFENFTDAGVGIGRNFADDDQLSFFATVPVTRHWLVTPELTLSRQGGRQPRRSLPCRKRSREYADTLRWNGGEDVARRRRSKRCPGSGPPHRKAAGYHHVTNAGNVSGKHRRPLRGRARRHPRLFDRRGACMTERELVAAIRGVRCWWWETRCWIAT